MLARESLTANLYLQVCPNKVLGENNFASKEIMPISNVKPCGVDFDHASVAGESPAKLQQLCSPKSR